MSAFRVLGPVEAWADERRVALGGPQQVTLLAFLLLNANRAVSADAITDALWGAERQRAGGRLQTAVFRLRRALAPLDGPSESRLRTVSNGYLLSVAPSDLDAEVFADQVRLGRRAIEQNEPARASDLLNEALTLWRGPPLAEVAFEDFAQAEIRRLEELRLAALECRIEADLHLGRHADLVAELEVLHAEQPSRERIAAQLMTVLYRSARQADALEVYQQTRTHLAEQLGLEPGPMLKELQAQILEHAPVLQQGFARPSPSSAPPPSGRGVPSPATPTIGRERELGEIRLLLLEASGARLVTLTGPGGVGKTRLALVAAHALEHEFEQGVCWVELAGVTRAEDVGSTLVRGLDATLAPGESATETLLRYLATRQLLLVVDNFEHVLDSAALIGELLAACPQITVLATSREALGIAAEQRYEVSPMAVPPRPRDATVAEVEGTAATALFLAAARRHQHGYAIDPSTAPLVARVCDRLDGLPLAVELAAARVGVLTLSELDARLSDSVGVRRSAPRDAPERQQTLQATIRWSYQLLRDEEQQAFLRFSVFAGGATLPAAQEVCGASLETLETLREKSVLRHRGQPDGTTRLVMLETIRQFAADERTGREDMEEIGRRHCGWYRGLVEQCVPRLGTADEAESLDALDRDIDNIHHALTWALAAEPAGAVRLTGLLGDYWSIHNDSNGLTWMDAALTAAGDRAAPEDLARLQLGRALQLSLRWEWQAATDATTSALEIYTEVGDDAGLATAYGTQSVQNLRLGHLAEARVSADAACSYARAAGDDALLGSSLSTLASVLPHSERAGVMQRAAQLLSQAGDYRGIARLYSNAGWIAVLRGQPAEAIELLGRALAAAEKLRSPATWKTVPLSNLGLAHLLAGNPEDARAAFVEALKLCTSEAFRWGGNECLVGLGAVLVGEGQLEQAAQLLAAARAGGYPGPDPDDQRTLDRLEREYFAAARASLGETRWSQLTRLGEELAFDQAVALALTVSGPVEDSDAARAHSLATSRR